MVELGICKLEDFRSGVLSTGEWNSHRLSSRMFVSAAFPRSPFTRTVHILVLSEHIPGNYFGC